MRDSQIDHYKSIKSSDIKPDVELLRIPSFEPPPASPKVEQSTRSSIVDSANSQANPMSKFLERGQPSISKRASQLVRQPKMPFGELKELLRNEPTTIVIDRFKRPYAEMSRSSRRPNDASSSSGGPPSSTDQNTDLSSQKSHASPGASTPDERTRTSPLKQTPTPAQELASKRVQLAKFKSKSKRETILNVDNIDRTTLKYSYNHLQQALSRAKYSGSVTMFTFWLLFLVVSLVIDNIQSDQINPMSFSVEQAIDVGIISNIDAGKFGWIAILLGVMLFFEVVKEFLSSRHPCMTITASVTILLIYANIIILFTLSHIWSNQSFKAGSYLVVANIVCWLVWTVYQLYNACLLVITMDDPSQFPPSSI